MPKLNKNKSLTDKMSDILEKRLEENTPYYVVVFTSRNKDNEGKRGFIQRKYSFVTRNPSMDAHRQAFLHFVEEGVQGEFSRCYMSINGRNPEAVHKAFLHYLIDHPEVNFENIETLLASITMKESSKTSKKFLFDFDADTSLIDLFITDITAACSLDGDTSNKILKVKTPNGYAVVTDHGFDTRKLLLKWEDVELKRDGFLFMEADTEVQS